MVTAPESEPESEPAAPSAELPSSQSRPPSALALQFEGTPSVAADRARFTCAGRAPVPGTALRDVGLCDLLAADAAKDKQAPRYELVAAYYADVRPTWSSHGATLCDGEEIVLVVEQRKHDAAEPRECVQLRCVSSFPPAPTRIGKNGEFCRSDAGVFEGWTLSPGRVEARHAHALSIWHLNPVGERFEYVPR